MNRARERGGTALLHYGLEIAIRRICERAVDEFVSLLRAPLHVSYRLVRALLIKLRRGTIASPRKVRGVRV